MTERYQLIVIGSGPGGYVSAIKAAQLGIRTAVVEGREVGGTCLNRGCIPTKAFLHTAELLSEIKSCEKLGIRAENVTCDLPAMHARKNEVVSKLRSGVEGLLKANKIDLIRGTAKITRAGEVCVGEDRFKAEKILIAVGSRPARPPIPGIDLPGVVTSDEMLSGEACHKRLVIIGGGVVGVEFAAIWNALGCEVTVIEAMDRILPSLDREISQNLSMILKRRGVCIRTGAQVAKLSRDDGLTCHFTAGGKAEAVNADGILVSVGRRANTEGLLSEDVDLGLERGYIPVDRNFETSAKGIYAVGDAVKGGVQLAHAASAQGINAVCAMFGQKAPLALSVIPSCIYTSPEIATVGMTSDEAKAQGIAVKTGKFAMSANGRTVISDGERGFLKVVAHAETGVILGAQMMCSRATDMIGELSTAIVNGLTVEQLYAVIRPHPTFGEAVSEALEDIDGRAVHKAPECRPRR